MRNSENLSKRLFNKRECINMQFHNSHQIYDHHRTNQLHVITKITINTNPPRLIKLLTLIFFFLNLTDIHRKIYFNDSLCG